MYFRRHSLPCYRRGHCSIMEIWNMDGWIWTRLYPLHSYICFGGFHFQHHWHYNCILYHYGLYESFTAWNRILSRPMAVQFLITLLFEICHNIFNLFEQFFKFFISWSSYQILTLERLLNHSLIIDWRTIMMTSSRNDPFLNFCVCLQTTHFNPGLHFFYLMVFISVSGLRH